jgi:hypothetical protein
MKKENLTRTQVLLEPGQLKTLTRIAAEEGKSVSALLREWIDLGLRAHGRERLAEAARHLAETYYADGDLVGYAALDGDDFAGKGDA